ncbi:hypothetical protein CJ030_MR8G023484 [Morella rubra]|uniref:Uncharacterized protein n=1 Tax=Morella rubra TaxID=262757 RepID=A0A6A1UTJ4_9ROSI|nr:hypothetical protein CJ030_MR8G023484 [Morella rubra]
MKPPKSFYRLSLHEISRILSKCKEPFRAALSFKSVESSFIVFYVKVYIKCQELSVHAQRTGTGSSSQEQEVADPMMTLERRMEYLRGRPVAKERPVTLSDFDQLLYEEHSLYQLFEYQGFIHQLSWTEGSSFRGVVIAASDTRKEVKSALNKFTLSRSRGQEGALTRRFARRAAAAVEEASRPSTSASEAPMETGAPAVPPPWMAQLFADFDSRVGATMKATLQPFERRMQSMEEQLKELRTAFDGECTVTMLRNKSVVAHMADVNEQLEELKRLWMISRWRQIHRGFPEIFLMTWPLSVMLFDVDEF